MKSYKVKVIREPGNDPLTGKFYNRVEENMSIEAESKLKAHLKAQACTKLEFSGLLMRTIIDGEEYFDERY